MRCVLVAAWLGALLAVGLVALAEAPAQAAARVSVSSARDGAAIDPTYATTLTLRGSGFQSIAGGFGGIYVLFGTVRGGERLYVPDSQDKDNAGYERFIAFPGSESAESASSTMTAGGSWSTTLNVPGAVFSTTDSSGRTVSVDCRKVTCGVITIGAHGVTNARNESFTPVQVKDLYAASPSASPSATASSPVAATASASPRPSSSATSSPDPVAPSAPSASGAPAVAPVPAGLDVDRAAAHPGNVLAFAASGLTPGAQVSAILDDGAAGAGPFLVGGDGAVGGVVTIPPDAIAGTHQLRLFGVTDPPTVSFAITTTAAAVDDVAPVAARHGFGHVAVAFAVAAGVVLLVALVRLVVVRRRVRRG